jgi:hypothetical protein
MWLRHGRAEAAAVLLEPVVTRFVGTIETADLPDLTRARALLAQAGSVSRPQT